MKFIFLIIGIFSFSNDIVAQVEYVNSSTVFVPKKATISKPNPSIFEMTFIKANEFSLVKKNEILHIGDNKVADFEGAINYGLKAHLIKF